MGRSANEGGAAVTVFGDCTFCGGTVDERQIEYDYRRREHLLVISNVPAGVCRQCGEKYFQGGVLKRMDTLYHEIFDHHRAPERLLEVPAVSFSSQRGLTAATKATRAPTNSLG